MARKEDSKLNIAIIHPDLGIGGAERLIVDAAVELASHGHNVHIFTAHHDKNRCFEETVSGTFQVTVCGAFLPQHIFYHLHAVCAYLRWCSIVIFLIYYWLNTTFLRRLYRRPIDFIEEIITGMADMILVNGKFTASTFANTVKHLHTQGIRPAVLYPAVNVDQFDEPQSYKLNFLSINRFERKRNVDLAVSAFAMLQNLKEHDLQNHDLKHSTLTIAGGCDKRLRENVEYLGELKSLAEREGVSDQINFVASCSTAERNDEQFDIVPLEAMAAYKPVIACNNGGPVEAVKDGVTGFLRSPTPREFSLTMAKLIRDPPMAERMGVEARKHVTESFSTKIFCQRLNQYLSNIASYP